jgi:hypothetical protein
MYGLSNEEIIKVMQNYNDDSAKKIIRIVKKQFNTPQKEC